MRFAFLTSAELTSSGKQISRGNLDRQSAFPCCADPWYLESYLYADNGKVHSVAVPLLSIVPSVSDP